MLPPTHPLPKYAVPLPVLPHHVGVECHSKRCPLRGESRDQEPLNQMFNEVSVFSTQDRGEGILNTFLLVTPSHLSQIPLSFRFSSSSAENFYIILPSLLVLYAGV